MSPSFLSAVCSSAAVFAVCGTVMSVPLMLIDRLESLELRQDRLEKDVARMKKYAKSSHGV